MNYLIFGVEKGESGTEHLQGYIEFHKRRTLGGVRRLIPRAHWEIARGSPKQNVEYCSKDGDFEQFGELSRGQGSRSDLLAVKKDIDDGATMPDIWNLHFPSAVKYHRAFEKYIEIKKPPRSGMPEVIIYWGATGTGKSRRAFENNPGAYWKAQDTWWDGYCGQSVVILDEFYGWLSCAFLLRLLDRYPLDVQIKGGYTRMVATKFVFTSNHHPDEWWSNAAISDEKRAAFNRRISSIVEFKSINLQQG